jgi:alpha-2-macroglobulin-like protein
MNTCHDYQTLLLDHLYGLLDEAEAAELRAHLEGCDACRASLAAAERQQHVLAAAARGHFPEVRFEPPVVRAEAAATPSAVTLPARPRRWGRWALAAAVLLAAGLGSAGGGVWYAYGRDAAHAREEHEVAQRDQERRARKQQEERQRGERDIAEIQEQIRLLEAKWDGEASQVQREYADREVQVTVTGPKTVQAGAPNVFQFEARRQGPGGKGEARRPKLNARILDAATNRVLCSQPVPDGTTRWELPRDLPVKPGSQLSLVIAEEDEAPVAAARLFGSAVAPTGPLNVALNSAATATGRVHLNEALQLIGTLHVSQVTTDRPMYRPGETVRFRSLTLERFSLKPAGEDLHLQFRITDPRGGEVFKLEGPARVASEDGKAILGPDGKAVRGVGAGAFRIPPEAPGGEYTLTLSEARGRFPPERRKFLVNQYQAPRLNKEVEFTRKSYGPGDVVEANCKVARVEGGGVIDDQPVVVSAQVDGQPCTVLDPAALRVRQGKVTVRVRLPDRLERGEGSLSVQFQDGGTHETTVRPLPIVLKKLFVEFFPEGGYLIAGVPNRVYFSARTTLDKPAELRGRLVDQDGKEVTAVRTLNDDQEAGVNQGLGLFEFTPQAGKRYELRIDSPIGIEGRYWLPQVKADGVALSIPEGVFTDKLRVVLGNVKRPRTLLVGAYCRGRLLDHARVEFRANEEMAVLLKPAAEVSGVFRVTVFEERPGRQLVPVAERLVYRRPVERLELKVTADKDHYGPGERPRLTLRAADEKGRAVPAIVMLSAVDLGIIKLADEKTARSLPTHFFLTTEVRQPEDLEYADFLVGTHPKAAAALDLLLGTQGWRRFAEQDPGKFRQEQKQDAERLLLASGHTGPEQKTLAEVRLIKVDQAFIPKWVKMQKKLATREAEDERELQQAAAEQARLRQRLAETGAASRAAEAELSEVKARLLRYGLIAAAVGLLALAFVGVGVGMNRLSQGMARGAPYLATGVCAGLILFVGALGLAVSRLSPQAEQAGHFRAAAPQENAQVLEKKKAFGGAGGGGFPEMPQADKAPPPEFPGAKGPPAEEGAKKADGGPGFPPPGPVPPRAEPQPAEPAPAPAAPPGVPPEREQRGRGPGKAEKGRERPADAEMLQGQNKLAQLGGPPDVKFMQELAKQDPKALQDALLALKPAGGEGGFGLQLQQNLDRQLRKRGEYAEIARRHLKLKGERAQALPAVVQPLVVREYAHRHLTSADNVRRDFTETVSWHPVLVLPGGKPTEVAFDLSDAVTRYQVVVWGHTLDGRLGTTTAEVAARLPFSVSPKVPVEVTNTDKVTLPVTVSNDSGKSLSVSLDVRAKNLEVVGPATKQFAVDAGKRVRRLFSFRPSVVEGDAVLNFLARSDSLPPDRVEPPSFKIVPDGFPVVGSRSDRLEGVAVHKVVLPETWVPGTLQVRAQVFPSTLADLQKGLEALLREPCGCFEQSSSSNYPNVLILSYLKESEQANPEVEKQARRLLNNGYGKLVQFECQDPEKTQVRRGYEWFGRTAPPHEALTAYGLLQFRDMARVHPVDGAMLERTKKYLLGQRDGAGGFKRNARALDSFGRAPAHITDAYIVWALTEAEVPDNLDVELKALLDRAKASKDPYFVALVGLGHLNRGKSAEALELLKSLRGAQQADGRLTGAQTSITGSGGRDLDIETTALATLGWLRANRPDAFNDSLEKAARWLGQQRGGYGGFGSTQSTILALKALIAFTQKSKTIAEDADLVLSVNGKEVARKRFTAGTREELALTLGEGAGLKPGPKPNVIRVEMAKNNFPHTLTWSYRTLKPANAPDCPVRLTTKLDRKSAPEGKPVRLTATVENRSGKGQGMTVAVLGLPGGLTVPEDMKQLKRMTELRERGTKPGPISAFEVRDRELVLYWRDLAPAQKIEVSVDLICRVPGEYRGPASRAYLYYNADRKFWAEPLAITITPQAE